MSAGRELDALIAERIFGWMWYPVADTTDRILAPPSGDPKLVWATEWDDDGIPGYLSAYSTDIAAAWEVIEKMGIATELRWHRIDKAVAMLGVYSGPKFSGVAEADTMPLAICLAALKAVGVEVPT